MPVLEELRILVVEDNQQARAMIRMMCRDLGIHQVYTANDGRQALDFLGSCDDEIDLVICDWRMPRVTGIDVLRQIRTCDPDLPFLMLTGVADRMSVLEAKECGVSAYLRKPFSPEQLEAKLRALLTTPREGPTTDEDAPRIEELAEGA